MMTQPRKDASTAPKPFVFVLMPFDHKFRDIYEFGIKGAVGDVGAYAERVDEQIFATSILDRIYNQINKADVIVADMTGRNANVFYEVGYAHALGKIVLLLTQDADDIPFDLKHHQHTVYAGEIGKLRNELTQRLRWAIAESRERGQGLMPENIVVSSGGAILPELPSSLEPPIIELRVSGHQSSALVVFTIRNQSAQPIQPIPYLYVLSTNESALLPYGVRGREKSIQLDSGDVEFPGQFRLDQQLALLPSGAVEEIQIIFVPINGGQFMEVPSGISDFRLRLHGIERVHDFAFRLRIPN